MVAGKEFIGWRARLGIAMLVLCLIWLITVIISIAFGGTSIPATTAWGMLLYKIPYIGPELIEPFWSKTTEIILYQIRLPRLLLGSLVGASLGVAGATFQGLLRNPLADPYTIGVSSGAAVGAVIAILLQGIGQGIGMVPIFALVGAMLTITLVYQLARIGGRVAVETLILSGVIVGSFMTSILSFLLTKSYDNLQQVIYWLMGSLSLRSWEHVVFSFPYLIAGMLIIWFFARDLNALALGEDTAQHLGVEVERVKTLLLFLASLITALAVSVSGTIGFVGLTVPHVVRMVLGPDHRVLIPVSALTGSIFLILADTIARTSIAPSELPVGVVTAFVGAPFFAYLLRAKKKSMSV
ncbi:MAG: FecCD family ABC transporter permease [Bacillota bacterium]